MAQCIQEQIGVLPAIEAERHFVQIGRKMFCADFMPGSDDAALQKAESVLDCVGMNIRSEAYIFLLCVIHRLMPIAQFTQSLWVGCQFIGHDHIHILRDIFLDITSQSSALCILGVEESQLTIALPNADHYLFVGRCFPAPWVSLLSTHVGFIHLDSTIQHGSLGFFHSSTNAMAEIPCSLIRAFMQTPNSSFQLVSAHTFLSFAEQQYSHEPDRQRQMRIMEDRIASDGELILTANAFVSGVLLQPGDSPIFASRTGDALWPTQTFQQFTASVISRIERIH